MTVVSAPLRVKGLKCLMKFRIPSIDIPERYFCWKQIPINILENALDFCVKRNILCFVLQIGRREEVLIKDKLPHEFLRLLESETTMHDVRSPKNLRTITFC